MNIMDTMTNVDRVARPLLRYYSPQLKTQVAQKCRRIGASVAGSALSHAINSNIVHRWPLVSVHANAIRPSPRDWLTPTP